AEQALEARQRLRVAAGGQRVDGLERARRVARFGEAEQELARGRIRAAAQDAAERGHRVGAPLGGRGAREALERRERGGVVQAAERVGGLAAHARLGAAERGGERLRGLGVVELAERARGGGGGRLVGGGERARELRQRARRPQAPELADGDQPHLAIAAFGRLAERTGGAQIDHAGERRGGAAAHRRLFVVEERGQLGERARLGGAIFGARVALARLALRRRAAQDRAERVDDPLARRAPALQFVGERRERARVAQFAEHVDDRQQLLAVHRRQPRHQPRYRRRADACQRLARRRPRLVAPERRDQRRHHRVAA